jgi:hypothetical protein
LKNIRTRITAILGIAVVALGIGSTSAAASPDNADYTDQAQELGLSRAEAVELQNQVDGYLAKLGGRQVGINKIDLPGAVLLVPLPGEAGARDLDDPSIQSHECPYQYFCAYALDYYSGSKLLMFNCTNYTMPFAGVGSYINNQTSHTRAQFKDQNFVVIDTSGPATWAEPYYDWTPVFYVKPC